MVSVNKYVSALADAAGSDFNATKQSKKLENTASRLHWLKHNICAEIERLAKTADLVVHMMFDGTAGVDTPDYHKVYKLQGPRDKINLSISLNYEGISVWHIVWRSGEEFESRKILIEIKNGEYVTGQIGSFQGFWEEFPHYVSEDRWVQKLVGKLPTNENFR